MHSKSFFLFLLLDCVFTYKVEFFKKAYHYLVCVLISIQNGSLWLLIGNCGSFSFTITINIVKILSTTFVFAIYISQKFFVSFFLLFLSCCILNVFMILFFSFVDCFSYNSLLCYFYSFFKLYNIQLQHITVYLPIILYHFIYIVKKI